MMGIWHATAVRTLSMCYVWLSAGITVAGVFDIMPRYLGSAESFIVPMKRFAGKDVSFRNMFGSTSLAILKPMPLPLTLSSKIFDTALLYFASLVFASDQQRRTRLSSTRTRKALESNARRFPSDSGSQLLSCRITPAASS